jgi:hypothetical protein
MLWPDFLAECRGGFLAVHHVPPRAERTAGRLKMSMSRDRRLGRGVQKAYRVKKRDMPAVGYEAGQKAGHDVGRTEED